MESHMHIEEEIIMDMLSRLPVKSLVRFKCVSKSWKALICEPRFRKKHFNHAKNNKLLIERIAKDRNIFFYASSLSTTTTTTTTSQLIVRDVQESVFASQCVLGFCKIYCSCDGLFLIGISENWNKKYFLWNPSTRESILLPSPPNNFFDNFPKYGLGYDPTSDDYKVVKVPEGDEDAPIEILSLKTGSWRKIDDGYCCVQSDNMDCLAFVQETFHWFYLGCSRFSMISFNISNEVFGEIPLSKEMPFMPDVIEQGVTILGDMLSVNFVRVEENTTTIFDLWVMKDYAIEESWTKLFTMRDTRIPREVLPIVPKYIFADGEVLLSSDRGEVFRTFKESDRRSKLVEPIIIDEDTNTSKWYGYCYTESLISPKDCVLA